MNWLQRLYTAPLRWLEAAINLFVRNRHRVAMWARRPRVAAVITTINVVTVAAWLVIWSMADEADRTRLTDQLSEYWDSLQTAPQAAPEPEPTVEPVHDLAENDVPRIEGAALDRPENATGVLEAESTTRR